MLINSAIQFARVFTTRGLREAREESRRWALSAEPGRRGRATPCKGLPVAGTARLSQVHGDCPWSPPGCGYGDIVDGVLSTSRGCRSGLGRDGSKAWQWLGDHRVLVWTRRPAVLRRSPPGGGQPPLLVRNTVEWRSGQPRPPGSLPLCGSSAVARCPRFNFSFYNFY